MTIFRRGRELDLPRGGDGALSESKRKGLQRPDLDHLAGTCKHRAQNDSASDLIPARIFCVLRFGFIKYARALIDFSTFVRSLPRLSAATRAGRDWSSAARSEISSANANAVARSNSSPLARPAGRDL